MTTNNDAHEIWAIAQGNQSIDDAVSAIEEILRQRDARTLREAFEKLSSEARSYPNKLDRLIAWDMSYVVRKMAEELENNNE